MSEARFSTGEIALGFVPANRKSAFGIRPSRRLSNRTASLQYVGLSTPSKILPAPLVALASWLVPGLGYVLIGERARGIIAGTTIVVTFLLGLLIGGIRVIDVPGYDVANNLRPTSKTDKTPAIKTSFVGEVMYKPWYIAQSLAGPMNIVATVVSVRTHVRPSTARIFDIGTLYTAIAGMLNLLVIIDSAYRATYPHADTAPDASETPSGSAA